MKYIFLLSIGFIFFVNCYTTLSPPLNESDEALTDGMYEYSPELIEESASIPPVAIDDYNWYFYYVSPWWIDVDQTVMQKRSKKRAEDLRRRIPNGSAGSLGPRAGSVGPSVRTSLSKKAASTDTNDGGSGDTRRGFSRRKVSQSTESQQKSSGSRKRKR